jgi:type II secretory pathway component PulF
MTRPPLDYRTPTEPEHQGARFSLAMALPVGLFVLVLFIILMFVIPRLELVYKDFGSKLPLVTMIVLNASRWFRSVWILWPMLLCLPVVAGLCAPQSKSAQRWLRLLMVVCFAGIVILIALAVFMPLISLTETISNPKR